MRWVVDSNVLVSALLSPHGPPAQVLRLVLQRDLRLLHDARVLAEYDEVLARPFLEIAVEGRADALVTGNPRHFRPLNGEHGVRIMAPRELVDYLGGATLL